MHALLGGLGVVGLCAVASAQTVELVRYDFGVTGSTTQLPNSTAPNLTASTFAPSSGIVEFFGGTPSTGGNQAISSNNWNTTPRKFYSFTLTPDAGQQITLTNLAFHHLRSNQGPQQFEVLVGPTGGLVSVASGTITTGFVLVSQSLSAIAGPHAGPVTVRMEAGNANGNWRIDNVVVTGEVTSIGGPTATFTTAIAAAPASVLLPSTNDNLVTAFTVDASASLTLDEVTVSHSGTGSAGAVAAVGVWHDANGDGVLDTTLGTGDPLVGLGSVGAITFTTPVTVTSTELFFVTYDLDATVGAGQTFIASVSAASTTPTAAVSGLPLSGATHTVDGVTLARDGLGSLPAIALGALNAVLEITADTIGANTLDALEVELGQGDPAHVTSVQLWHDANGDSFFDPATDALLASDTFAGGSAILLPASPMPLGAASTTRFFVAFDVSGSGPQAGDFFQARAIDAVFGSTAAVTGLPIEGPVHSVGASSLVEFDFDGAVNQPVTFPASATAASLLQTVEIARGSSIGAASSTGAFSANTWPTGGIDTVGGFFTFTFEPNPGLEVRPTRLRFVERRSSTGPRDWSIRSSLDGFATNLVSVNVPDNDLNRSHDVPLIGLSSTSGAVEVRFYGFNAEQSQGSWRLDDIVVEGFTTSTTATGTAPQITSADSATARVGASFSHTITASGTQPIAFSVTGAPGWLTLTGDTLSGTPSSTDVGTTQLTITATNTVSFDTQQFTVEVFPVLAFSSAQGNATVAVGQGFSYTPTAVGTPPINFNITLTPTAGWLGAIGNAISGTPSSSDAGTTTTVSIVISNGLDPDQTQTFDVTVPSTGGGGTGTGLVLFDFDNEPGNQASTDASFVAANLVTPVTVSRGPGLTPSSAADCISSSGWPIAGAAFDPAQDFYTITIAPSPGFDLALTELRFQHRRSGQGPLQARVRSSVDGFTTDLATLTLLNNTSDQTETVTLAGIAGQSGPVEVRIYGTEAVSSGGTWRLNGTDQLALDGVITPGAPVAPTITSQAPTTASENALYSYTVQASGTAPITFAVAATTTLPGWLSFDAGTATLSGTPSSTDVGAHGPITLEATNAQGTDTETFSITVDPALGVTVVINEVLYDFNVTVSGQDPESVELLNLTTSTIPLDGWQLKDDQQTFTFPSGTDLGPNERKVVSLRVGSTSFGAYAALFGAPPAIDASAAGLDLADAGDLVALVDDQARVMDYVVYGNGLVNGPNGLPAYTGTVAAVASNAALAIGRVPDGQDGDTATGVAASEDAAATFASVPPSVGGPNDAPVVEVFAPGGALVLRGAAAFNERALTVAGGTDLGATPIATNVRFHDVNATVTARYTFDAASSTFASLAAAGLVLPADQTTAGGGFANPATQLAFNPGITGSLTFNSGTAVIVVTATDGTTTTTERIVLTVTGALAISTASPLPRGTEGAFYSQTFAAVGGAGALTWTASGTPSFLTLDSVTGVLSGTPAVGQAGTFNFTVSVSDGSLQASKAFSLTIDPQTVVARTDSGGGGGGCSIGPAATGGGAGAESGIAFAVVVALAIAASSGLVRSKRARAG